MEEKILVKSENEKNYFITIGVAILVGGFLLSTIFGLDSIAYCMYPWSFSFYYVWPSIILIVAGFIYNGSEIVITDKRAYGTTSFKKRIDLPVDSISAVGSSHPKGISISTSSGRISFAFIKNQDEIYKCINNLLIERQNNLAQSTDSAPQEAPKSDIGELKKYKELLDSGIITQEEFDAKKKQLLGL